MNTRKLVDEVAEFVAKRELGAAEDLLLEARGRAVANRDSEATRMVLSELVEVYCLMDPPRLDEAERCALEREDLDRNAGTVLQTAMMLYHAAHDYPRAIAKLEEVITLGEMESDDGAVYSGRAMLGLALIQLDRKAEAATILKKIEEMILARKSVAIGDETIFLEHALEKGIDPPTVRRVASVLAANCPDPEFAERLRVLASS